MKTSLGSWAGFEDNYSVMKFTGGQGCWQGPARSMKVRNAYSLRADAVHEHVHPASTSSQHPASTSSQHCHHICKLRAPLPSMVSSHGQKHTCKPFACGRSVVH